jgi:hypothetical protein
MRSTNAVVRTGAALLLVLAALAGCGGADDGGPEAGGASPSPANDLRVAALHFSACMRGAGYDLPDPTFNDQGYPAFREPELRGNAEYERKRAECRVALDEAAVAAGAPSKEESTQQLLAFARCMRERGVNMPDPPADGGPRLDGSLLSSPAWRPAAEACREHLPAKYQSLVDGNIDGGKKGVAPK